MTDDFKAYASDLENRLSGALGAEAERIAAAARIRASEARDGARPGSGQLADSISAAGSGLDRRIEATAPYAAYVEFGTRFMPARPFLWPSVDEARQSIVSNIVSDMNQ